jgi:hypothetical protein
MSADTRKAFEAWAKERGWNLATYPGGVYVHHELAACLAAWTASRSQALEEAAQMADKLKPAGGRAWSESQAACFAALDELAAAIRKLGAQG